MKSIAIAAGLLVAAGSATALAQDNSDRNYPYDAGRMAREQAREAHWGDRYNGQPEWNGQGAGPHDYVRGDRDEHHDHDRHWRDHGGSTLSFGIGVPAYGYAQPYYGGQPSYGYNRYSPNDGRAYGLDDRYECWNPHAGHFEGVRPGDIQDDLDFSRCRLKPEYAGGYGYYYGR